MELMAFQDYRAYLKNVLEKRIAGNPKYSLRAFARKLRISPQMLSFVLNGKRGISLDAATDIASKLDLNPEEVDYFVSLVVLAHSKSLKAKELAQNRINKQHTRNSNYVSLDLEAFQAISDWHHYAILELTFVNGFKYDPKWIAKKIGISTFEATQAIERLKKLELLEETQDTLKKSELNISATYGAPTSALRKLAMQILKKAIDSLETQSFDERDITSITMAIDPKKLPQAKKMILDFRRKLCAFLEQGDRSEVYVFAPALFRLTQKN